MDFDSFIDSLGNDALQVRATSNLVTYPCGQCAGTGKWSGGTNYRGNSDCLACKGKGSFKTSPEFRSHTKAVKVARVATRQAEVRADIDARWGDLIVALRREIGWSEFARDLVSEYDAGKVILDKRMQAAAGMMAKVNATRAAKAAQTTAKGGNVDLGRIREMFDTAQANGHKKPVYRAEGLKISLAPATGRNAGALYVVEIDSDGYQGKLEGTTFKAVREASVATFPALQRIAADPMDAAVRYGRKTGSCSCCGRELTNAESISLGIGPICRAKWGL